MERVQGERNGSTRREADLLGAWLARAGAVAILIAAGFAFKWGVDRGIIGPAARVWIGVASGAAFVGWGFDARRRGWSAFAQAVTAGGLALTYLSVLAASELYDLLPGGLAFIALVAVTVVGGVLAHVHASAALALMALGAAYLNPFLVAVRDDVQPAGIFAYLTAVALLLLTPAFAKWRGPSVIALAGTVAVFAAVQDDASRMEAVTAATVLLAIFTTVPFLRRVPGAFEDVAVPVTAAVLHLFFVASLMTGSLSGFRGAFAMVMAVALVGVAALSRELRPGDTAMRSAWLTTAAGFAVLAVAYQFEGAERFAAWGIEGLVFLRLPARSRTTERDLTAAALLGVGALGALTAVTSYRPDRLLVTAEGLSVAIVALTLALAAVVLRADAVRRAWAVAPGAMAAVLGLAWATAEAAWYVTRTQPAATRAEALQFAMSATWVAYGGLLLAVGVVLALQPARLFGAALIGFVAMKLVLNDVWMLDTGMRTVAFAATGAVMLACSLMYQRLRDLLLRDETAARHNGA